MTIVSRIFATAALFSLAIVSSAPGAVNALSIEHANVHARAAKHHAQPDSVRRFSENLNTPQRRCKVKPSPSPSTTPAAPSDKPPVNAPPAPPAPVTTHSHTTTSHTHTTSSSSKPPAATPKPPVASPKPPSTSGGKVGLAWSNGEDACLGKYVTSKTKYLYTWDSGLPANLHGLQGARMLWGNAPNKVAAFRQLRTVGPSRILMGMNEVNEKSQANMDVPSGIALWNKEIRPFGLQGYTLISPAVTSSDTGTTWLQGFFKNCGNYDGQSNCGVDFLSVHYYGNTAKGMISYIEKFWQLFGIKIWVTEFACEDFVGNNQCSASEVWSFMQTVTSWMDSTSYVDAYFAFGLLHDMWNVNYLNQLMASDCSPTSLGSFFINA